MAVKKKTVQRSLDLAGNAEGAMTKYWVFARGGAWRNPKPTGGPYVCEQCRLDACGGNDTTLTMQAVTTTELAPADVCADCGARLLEELEVTERWGSGPDDFSVYRQGRLSDRRDRKPGKACSSAFSHRRAKPDEAGRYA